MCINDWRLGRLMRAIPIPSIVGDGNNRTIPPNPNRVGLLISVSGLDATVIHQAIVNLPNGSTVDFSVANGSSPVMISLATHGDLCTRQLYILAQGDATTAVGLIEFTLPNEVIAAAIEQFYSDYKLPSH